MSLVVIHKLLVKGKKMQPSPQKDDFLLSPPTKSGGRNSLVSKMGTWASYKINIYKKPIIIVISVIALSVAAYGGGSYALSAYKENRAERIAAEQIEKVKANTEYVESLKKAFATQAILTPMTDVDVDKVIAYAGASYLDSIKDLSRALYSMEYIAKEDKYEVVFETTQSEMTELVSYMNSEYTKVLQFMNTHKNLVRTYQAALEAGDMALIAATKPKMDENMKIYSDWYGWMVSGQYKKADRLKERVTRHAGNVLSLDGLNKYLQSKKAQIDNFEPFTQMVIRR